MPINEFPTALWANTIINLFLLLINVFYVFPIRYLPSLIFGSQFLVNIINLFFTKSVFAFKFSKVAFKIVVKYDAWN